jgi:hypothetical protein
VKEVIETEEIRKRLEGRMKPHDLEYVIGQLQTRDNRLADLESDLPWMLYTFAHDVVGGKHAHYMADARQFIFAYRDGRYSTGCIRSKAAGR